jgi:hypothetical protein
VIWLPPFKELDDILAREDPDQICESASEHDDPATPFKPAMQLR